MKTGAQLRYEASLRRGAIAHRAEPSDHGGWNTTCERSNCGKTFASPTRQRRYCSDRCRRLVENARQKRMGFVAGIVLVSCEASRCSNVLVPVSPDHRYCSEKCRKRGHRASSNLGPTRCAGCGVEFPETATRRRKYCGAKCRKRAHRAAQTITVRRGVSGEMTNADDDDYRS